MQNRQNFLLFVGGFGVFWARSLNNQVVATGIYILLSLGEKQLKNYLSFWLWSFWYHASTWNQWGRLLWLLTVRPHLKPCMLNWKNQGDMLLPEIRIPVSGRSSGQPSCQTEPSIISKLFSSTTSRLHHQTFPAVLIKLTSRSSAYHV